MYISTDRLVRVYEHQLVQGESQNARSYESLRITRVNSVGSEPELRWLINNRIYQPQSGDFLLLSCTDLRMPMITRRPCLVELTTLQFEPTVLFPNTAPAGFFFCKDLPKLLRAADASQIGGLFDRVIDEVKGRDAFSPTAVSSALTLLIIELCRCIGYSPDLSFGQTGSELIGRIVAYIGDNFTERITVSDTAAKIGISPSLLSKLMNDLLGMSFPEYVRRLRVSNVVHLMRDRGSGALDAAMDSGFSSVAGFYKTFRAITGVSPTEMLKSGTIPRNE